MAENNSRGLRVPKFLDALLMSPTRRLKSFLKKSETPIFVEARLHKKPKKTIFTSIYRLSY